MFDIFVWKYLQIVFLLADQLTVSALDIDTILNVPESYKAITDFDYVEHTSARCTVGCGMSQMADQSCINTVPFWWTL